MSSSLLNCWPFNKLMKNYSRLDSVEPDKIEPFNLEALPKELRDIILIEDAVTRRVAGMTLNGVKETMAAVSPVWREIAYSNLFHNRVQSQALLRGKFSFDLHI